MIRKAKQEVFRFKKTGYRLKENNSEFYQTTIFDFMEKENRHDRSIYEELCGTMKMRTTCRVGSWERIYSIDRPQRCS